MRHPRRWAISPVCRTIPRKRRRNPCGSPPLFFYGVQAAAFRRPACRLYGRGGFGVAGAPGVPDKSGTGPQVFYLRVIFFIKWIGTSSRWLLCRSRRRICRYASAEIGSARRASAASIRRCVCFYTEPEGECAFVRQKGEYLWISLDELLQVKAVDSYCTICGTDGGGMTFPSPLPVVEKELPSNRFMRIHRSYIVNLAYVESLAGNLLKISGTKLPVGREYRKAVLDRLVF